MEVPLLLGILVGVILLAVRVERLAVATFAMTLATKNLLQTLMAETGTSPDSIEETAIEEVDPFDPRDDTRRR